MINLSQLQEQVWEVVDALSSAPVVQMEQEGYEPADNFVITKLQDWEQVGSAQQEHSGGTSTIYTVKTFWKVTLRLMAVGVDSNQLLMEIGTKLNKSSTRTAFKGIGLAYACKDDIKPAPKLLNTGWEQRYVLDVYFHTVIEDTDDLGYFQYVDLTVEVEDEAGETVYEENQIIDIIS